MASSDRPSPPRWSRIAGLLALALVGTLSVGAQTMGALSVRSMVLLNGVGLAALIATARRFRSVKETAYLAVLMVALPVALSLASAATGNAWLYPSSALLASEMSAVLVFLSVWELARICDLRVRLPRRSWSAAAFALVPAAFLLVVAVRVVLFGRFAVSIDQNLYLLQAAHILHDPRGVRIPAALHPLLGIRQSYFHDGFLNGQYPPGWPAVLGLMRAAGLAPIVGGLLISLTVLGVVLLGRREESTQVGVSAGLLTLASWGFVSWGTTYFAEPLSGALAVYAALCLSLSTGGTGRRRVLLEGAAGALLGFLLATRPLTAVGIGVGLAVWRWQALRGPQRIRSATASIGVVTLGALPGTLALLWYNARTTGSALRFGYDLAHWGLQALGFGMRGWVGYDRFGLTHPVVAAFGPRDAIYGLMSMIVGTMRTCFPLVLILPLLFVARRLEARWRASVLLPFIPLPAAYFFYFYHDPRFYVELVPFLALAVAGFAWLLLRKDRHLAAALVAFSIWATAAGWGQFSLDHRMAASRLAYFHEIESLRRAEGRLLVFAHDQVPEGIHHPEMLPAGLLTTLYWYDSASFGGDVVVVRDVERLRSLAMACFPGRLPVEVSGGGSSLDQGVFQPPTLTVLRDTSVDGEICPEGWSGRAEPVRE